MRGATNDAFDVIGWVQSRAECWGARGVEPRKAAGDRKAEQWLADVSEDLEVLRYPTRRGLLQAVDEAARRADGLARLEYALLTLR